MTLVLDTGAFVALERNDRAMWRRLRGCLERDEVPLCHGGIVGQVWRAGGGRQALLARALRFIDVRPLDQGLGRRVGELLARSRTEDVIDAALVLISADGDSLLTSDTEELGVLAELADRHIELIPV